MQTAKKENRGASLLFHAFITLAFTLMLTGCGIVSELRTTQNIDKISVGMSKREVATIASAPMNIYSLGQYELHIYRQQPSLIKSVANDQSSREYLVVFDSNNRVLQIKDISRFLKDETEYKILGAREIDFAKLCVYLDNQQKNNDLIICK